MEIKNWVPFLALMIGVAAENEDVYVSRREWDDSGLEVIGQVEKSRQSLDDLDLNA